MDGITDLMDISLAEEEVQARPWTKAGEPGAADPALEGSGWSGRGSRAFDHTCPGDLEIQL